MDAVGAAHRLRVTRVCGSRASRNVARVEVREPRVARNGDSAGGPRQSANVARRQAARAPAGQVSRFPVAPRLPAGYVPEIKSPVGPLRYVQLSVSGYCREGRQPDRDRAVTKDGECVEQSSGIRCIAVLWLLPLALELPLPIRSRQKPVSRSGVERDKHVTATRLRFLRRPDAKTRS